MNITKRKQRAFLRWVEVFFHLCMGLIGVISFIYDNPVISKEEIIGSFMIVSASTNLVVLFRPVSCKAYERIVVLTSIAILFRPLNGIVSQIFLDDVSNIATINYATIWISLWVLYMIKALYISIPYLEKREAEKKFYVAMPENASE